MNPVGPETPDDAGRGVPSPGRPEEIDPDALDDVVGGTLHWPGGEPAPIPVPPPFNPPRRL